VFCKDVLVEICSEELNARGKEQLEIVWLKLWIDTP